MTNAPQAKPESVPADASKPAVSAPPVHGPHQAPVTPIRAEPKPALKV